MKTITKTRNYEIDGIRGWAAISVLFFHFFWETFGVKYPILRSTPLNFIFDGPLAIYVFFILSGDALSYSYFSTKTTFSTLRIILGRYFRLTFPILISCFIVYFLITFDLIYSHQAAVIVKRENWLGVFINFSSRFNECIKYSLYNVFFEHSLETSYNPYLWTMSIEMLGSMIVFINIFLIPNIKKPLVLLIIQLILFFLFKSWYSLFILGMIFGYLRSEGILNTLIQKKHSFLISIALFIGVILFDTLYRDPVEETKFSVNFILASSFIIAIYCNTWLISLFSSKISRFLGEISFPTYVLHFSILVSYTSWLTIKAASESWLKYPTVLWIPFSSIGLVIVAAILFRKLEVIFLKYINKNISDWIIEKDNSPISIMKKTPDT